MRKVCIIRADAVIVLDRLYILEDNDDIIIPLTGGQITLIAMGIANVAVSDEICVCGISTHDGYIKIENIENTSNSIHEMKNSIVDVQKLIQSIALNMIVEKELGLRMSGYGLDLSDDRVKIIKSAGITKNGRNIAYCYYLEEHKRVIGESIIETVDRWNNLLADGKYIVRADIINEYILSVDPNEVFEATKRAEKIDLAKI